MIDSCVSKSVENLLKSTKNYHNGILPLGSGSSVHTIEIEGGVKCSPVPKD
jgi:hypothetical protein